MKLEHLIPSAGDKQIMDVVDYMGAQRDRFKLSSSFYWIDFDTAYSRMGCSGGKILRVGPSSSSFMAKCENCKEKDIPYDSELCQHCGKIWYKREAPNDQTKHTLS